MTEKPAKQRTYSSAGPTSRAVGENLARLRDVWGLSTTELARRMKELGVPMQPSAITRVEKGERRATVDELMALAVILGIHPVGLLLPFTGAGTVEITGVGTVSARDAWKWAEGRQPLHVPADDDGTALVDFQKHARPKGIRTYPVGTPAGEQFAEEDGFYEALEAMGAKRSKKTQREDSET